MLEKGHFRQGIWEDLLRKAMFQQSPEGGKEISCVNYVNITQVEGSVCAGR